MNNKSNPTGWESALRPVPTKPPEPFVNPYELPERLQYGGLMMAINRKNQTLIFRKLNNNKLDAETVPYSGIQSSEVIVDADSYLKTDRVGQIGGALLGGALTGGIGALVMAMGAQKKNVEKIRKVQLKVIVKGSPDPVKIFEFSDGIFSSSRKMVDKATEWHDIIRGVMAEAETIETTPPNFSITQVMNQPSVADEIKKLSELKSQGLLCESEFQIAKQKLLSGG